MRREHPFGISMGFFLPFLDMLYFLIEQLIEIMIDSRKVVRNDTEIPRRRYPVSPSGLILRNSSVPSTASVWASFQSTPDLTQVSPVLLVLCVRVCTRVRACGVLYDFITYVRSLYLPPQSRQGSLGFPLNNHTHLHMEGVHMVKCTNSGECELKLTRKDTPL